MHFRTATAFLAAAGVAVNATPVNIISQVECLVVNAVVKALATYSSATPFCSSYLSIPTITSTATATSTVFITETTTTTTGTDTSTAPAVTVTETASETITTCVLSAVQKRSYKTTSKSSTTSTSTSKSTSALPSCVATFASAQISTACSCLSIPTPSTTVTSTVTVTPTATSIVQVAASATTTPTVTVTATSTSTEIVCPTPSSCDSNFAIRSLYTYNWNQGLQWAEYPNDQGDNNDATYSNFDAAVYKTQTPDVSGVTSTVGGIDASGGVAISIYGSSSSFYSDYFSLDHKGYLFAVATGTYTFTFSGVDDIAMLWLGPTAYAGWTRANANLVVPYHQGSGPGSGSTTIDLVEGQYLPIRVLFGQGQGSAVFQLSVAAPDGTVFLDSSTENSPYIVQYSCDGTTAPAYSPWGSEV